MTLWLHHLCLAFPAEDVRLGVDAGCNRLERWAWGEPVGITVGSYDPAVAMRDSGTPDLFASPEDTTTGDPR